MKSYGRQRRAGFLAAAALAVVFFVAPLAHAHTPHACPAALPDAPVLSRHIEHANAVSGKLSFDKVAAQGEALFTARFNRCDGQGRPGTESTGESRAAGGAPDFTRMSGPEASSCAGCHHQPFAGGAGEFVANVFVNARGTVPVAELAAAAQINERNTLGMHGAGLIEMLAIINTGGVGHKIATGSGMHNCIVAGSVRCPAATSPAARLGGPK